MSEYKEINVLLKECAPSQAPVTTHEKWVIIEFMFRMYQSEDNVIHHSYNSGPLISSHCIFIDTVSLVHSSTLTEVGACLLLQSKSGNECSCVILLQLHCKSVTQD